MYNDNNQLTFIDLFAGIGGTRIAFERAGAKCVFSSEIDKACQKTYKANFGKKPAGDVRKVLSEDIPDHDILTAGFPCQAFSIIGNGLGFADTRGTLFFEIERILRDKQPYAFLLENVKQLVTHNKGKTFSVIMDKLGCLGYHTHWKILNGLDFGVPQKRERVIIVGFKKNHPFEFPKRGREENLTLSDILEPDKKVHRKHLVSEYMKAKLANKVKHIPHNPSVWHENKSGNIGIHPFSCALRANASYNYLLVNGKRRLTPREMLRLQGFPETFKIIVNDSQLRKQVGNSVVIPKIEAVAKAMVKCLRELPVASAKQIPLIGDIEESPERRIYATEV